MEMPEEAPIEQVRRHLHSMRLRSTEAGVAIVEQVATAAEALIDTRPESADTEREIMDTVVRSLDLMTLLVDDAGRRQQGYPPAALHEAVHVLLEHMARIRPHGAMRTH
jgi:chemotaxis protein histidine kinase CheA